MKLYVADGSGNVHKVRILLSLLKVPCDVVRLDLGEKSEHKQPSFLALNPRGQVPVLQDGDVVLWDSAACLVYLARKHGGGRWLPDEPGAMANVMQWVMLSGSEIQYGLQYARRGLIHDRWTAGTLEQCQAIGRVALDVMEGRLKNNAWLASAQPTIADVACFPYVETAPQSRVPLDAYPAVTGWLERCRALPGWPAR
jgi:glutathione S-transferase